MTERMMNFSSRGIADRILGKLIPADSFLRSDRVWGLIVALATLAQTYLAGGDVQPILDVAVQSVLAFFDQGTGILAMALGAFGLGRAKQSARTF